MSLLSWIKRLGEPLCRTREEAEQHLTTELKQAVPQGWTVKRIERPRPAWRIVRDVIPIGINGDVHFPYCIWLCDVRRSAI